MFRIAITCGFLAVSGITSASADDEGHWYVEGGYHYANLDSDSESLTLGLIGGDVGYNFGNGFAVEAVLAQGVVEDDVMILGINVPFKAGTWYGLAGKYSYPMGEKGSLYGKLRYTSIEIEADALGVTVSDSEWKAGWAIGGTYDFSETAYVIGEFNQVMDSHTGVFVGIGFRF